MGALHSLQQKFSEVTLIEEEMEESDTTPTKTESLRHKRLLALDPRSPSEEITRTPIMVDQTPKPANTRVLANNLNETPKGVPTTKDPRSPTSEFLRTPINSCVATVSRQVNDEGLSLENTPMTGKGYDSESGIESAEVTPNVQYEKREEDAASNQTDSPDSALNDEKIGDVNSCASGRDNNLQNQYFECRQSSSSSTDVDTAPLIVDSDESSESGESPQKGKNQMSPIPLVSVKPKSEEGTPKRGVAKSSSQAVINKNTGSLSLTPGVTRSPLSLVKNSSTSLSQRSKMTARPGKSGYAMTSRVVDKENIFH